MSLLFRVFVGFADLPWGPKLAFLDICQSPTKLNLQLRRVAEFKQRFNDLFIKEVYFFDCFFF